MKRRHFGPPPRFTSRVGKLVKKHWFSETQSLQKLERKIGAGTGLISRWCRGAHIPDARFVLPLSKALQVEPVVLLRAIMADFKAREKAKTPKAA